MDWKSWALTIAMPAAAYYGAVAFLEFMAARAEADGVDDWQDLFWPRMLALFHRTRFEDVRRRVADRVSPDTTEAP